MVFRFEISEKEFQGQLVELAQRLGYEFIYHTWRSDHSPAGFPDLIFLKEGRLIVAELKAEGKQPSAEQYFWLCEFLKVTPDVYLWRPSDFNEILEVLSR